jgi:hypothetical protein
MWRALRWQPRSYPQVWALSAACYVVCAGSGLLIGAPHRQDALVFIGLAIGFIVIGLVSSWRLDRRRNG